MRERPKEWRVRARDVQAKIEVWRQTAEGKLRASAHCMCCLSGVMQVRQWDGVIYNRFMMIDMYTYVRCSCVILYYHTEANAKGGNVWPMFGDKEIFRIKYTPII